MQQTKGLIGRWQGAGLMATTLLGTGVFILPQLTVEIAGSNALWAWLLLTIAIIPVTLVFGRLSSRYPHAGGPAHIVEQAFGKVLGRCIGMSFLLLIPIGSAAALLIAYQFLSALFVVQGIMELVVQISLALLLFIINVRGIHISAKLQFTLTLLVVAIVIAMLIFSGITVREDALSSVFNEVKVEPIMAAISIAFWSFLGVEAMSHLANDFRNPKQDMLPAMMIGTAIVGVIYIVCTYLLIAIPTTSALAFVDVFNTLFGSQGALVIGILGVASSLAAVNVYLAGASRLLYSFSKEGVLPRFFNKENQHQVPIQALLAIVLMMMMAIVLTYIYSYQLEQLIAWTNGVFVIIYSATMLAAFKLLSSKYYVLVIICCVFFVMIGISIGFNMIYGFVLLAILWPILVMQQRFR